MLTAVNDLVASARLGWYCSRAIAGSPALIACAVLTAASASSTRAAKSSRSTVATAAVTSSSAEATAIDKAGGRSAGGKAARAATSRLRLLKAMSSRSDAGNPVDGLRCTLRRVETNMGSTGLKLCCCREPALFASDELVVEAVVGRATVSGVIRVLLSAIDAIIDEFTDGGGDGSADSPGSGDGEREERLVVDLDSKSPALQLPPLPPPGAAPGCSSCCSCKVRWPVS